MNTAEKYLEEIAKWLHTIPEADKQDILREIESHIFEATENGESMDAVLSRLGSPKKLAQSYSCGYAMEKQGLTLKRVFHDFAFYASTGLSGIIVIPFLSLMAFTFVLCSIFILIASVLNLFGITNMPFMVFNMPITGIWQIFSALIIGALLCWIAKICWNGLKHYMRFISENYYKRKLNR